MGETLRAADRRHCGREEEARRERAARRLNRSCPPRVEDSVITLLDYFTWNGAAVSTFVTPWIRFPAGYRRAELWIDTKLDTGGNVIGIDLQSSADKTNTLDAVSTSTGTIPGISVAEISSELGPWVRLKLTTNGAASSNTTLSVWLLPKDD